MDKLPDLSISMSALAVPQTEPFDLLTPDAEDPAVLAVALKSWYRLYPYICFGPLGIIAANPFEANLCRTIYCPPDITGNDPDAEFWTDAQLAGSIWISVARLMGNQGIPLRMPNWPLLISEVGKREGSRQRLELQARILFNGPSILQFMIRNCSAAVQIDESLFNDPFVRHCLEFMSSLSSREWDRLDRLSSSAASCKEMILRAYRKVD